jgi:alpha-mannosidase
MYSYPKSIEELDKTLARIHNSIYKSVADLKAEAWVSKEPVSYADRKTGKHKRVRKGQSWAKLFDCAWFNFKAEVPTSAVGSEIVLMIDLNGEGCVYDDKGLPKQGITNRAMTFEMPFSDSPAKRIVPWLKKAKGGEKIDVWVDAACNNLFGEYVNDGKMEEACVAVAREDVRQLYFDYEVLLDLLKNIDKDSARYARVYEGLCEVFRTIGKFEAENVQECREILSPLFKVKGAANVKFSAVGHSHLDLAWLWPIRETIRKATRTFSTTLMLMDEYDEYVFGASQAQLYQWVKDNQPSIYKRIKRAVEQGRWELQGGMWVEADTNIPSGESLVRQFLYGKRFFRKEFGKDIDHLWLPDVFGYSGSLPQIMAKSGIKYFMTQKMSWNLVNSFPHHSFIWEGIDGSKILSHMLPEETYNSPVKPSSLRFAEKNFKEKGVSENAMILFGIGDGGGGPWFDHLERLRRVKNIDPLGSVEQRPAEKFFKRLEKDRGKFRTWRGELYLERHQGTLTSQAKAKWYNRKLENMLREVEMMGAIAAVVNGKTSGGKGSRKSAKVRGVYEYPQARLDDIWREVLLYQFHDILPGSSIKRVYDEEYQRYGEIYGEVEGMIEDVRAKLAGKAKASGGGRGSKGKGVKSGRGKETTLLFNSLGWRRKQWLKVGRKWREVSVPGSGYRILYDGDAATDVEVDGRTGSLRASKRKLENENLAVRFEADGSIGSIYDKRSGREVLRDGEAGNELRVYDDKGDAWDFPMDYRISKAERFKLVSSKAFVDGPRAVLRQEYKFNKSSLRQDIILEAGEAMVRFESELDWRESEMMLRTSFPLAVNSELARCEIQYGHISRPTTGNTSWDWSKMEVCAHKWADISQADYGVALLNDCKYGYCVLGNSLDLNLARSPHFPCPKTDVGKHRFSYAIYPHNCGFNESDVIEKGYEFNVPVGVLTVDGGVSLPVERSYIKVDSDSVILEAVKKAERSGNIVLRFYESRQVDGTARVEFDFDIKRAWVTDLMEEGRKAVKVRDNGVDLRLKPFEIQTIEVEPASV